jgi:hypothetical protein
VLDMLPGHQVEGEGCRSLEVEQEDQSCHQVMPGISSGRCGDWRMGQEGGSKMPNCVRRSAAYNPRTMHAWALQIARPQQGPKKVGCC